MNSFHSLIPFLPSLVNHSTAIPRDSLIITSAGLDPRYIASGRPQQKTPFRNNPFIVAYVFFAAGTCLPSRYLAMNVYSASTIPAFRCHITIWIKSKSKLFKLLYPGPNLNNYDGIFFQ
jgi:hypothetical protein